MCRRLGQPSLTVGRVTKALPAQSQQKQSARTRIRHILWGFKRVRDTTPLMPTLLYTDELMSRKGTLDRLASDAVHRLEYTEG